MKRKSLLAVVLIVSIFSITGHALSFQKNRRIFQNYQTTQISHGGLRAFVKFTGQQIVIINNDAFDWTNVQLAVRALPVFHRPAPESLAGTEITHTLPRVKARGVYTISALQPVGSPSREEDEPAMRPVSVEIRCDTPQGRNFWAGRWE